MRRLNAITFKQLRALSQVCETGTISAAAEMLSLTPPAVHSQLKALEEIVGCQILKRGAEGFEPTPEGEALLGAWRISHSVLESDPPDRDIVQGAGRNGCSGGGQHRQVFRPQAGRSAA
ncbi:LysR family transcriptional regulator [Jhaorihella thermophila]|uniref:LysR family transcriptional regulator n=1 Tax=Jhaorihella thermophila TaxID=488547 RepID=UPI00360D91A8